MAALALAALATAAPAQDCAAPRPVCDARAAVFAVSAFDPYGSAVRIGGDLLVTNRHIVADMAEAELRLADGGKVRARVVPTAFAGDLILLQAKLPPGPALEPGGAASGDLYTVGEDIGTRRVRVFPKGRVLLEPEPGKPLARLHHTAYSQPGTSGGALVDAQGMLVAIVTSGGEGRNEAIPARRIAELRALSGEPYAAASAEIGRAYRDCTEGIERFDGAQEGAASLAARCTATGNRQMIDLAAQALGRAGRLAESVELFTRSLEMDPNAVNARLGLVVALVHARRYGDAAVHLRRLITVIPEEPRVQQYAVQLGKFADDADLAREGLALIERYNPAQLDAARRFLAAPLPRR